MVSIHRPLSRSFEGWCWSHGRTMLMENSPDFIPGGCDGADCIR